MRLRAEAGRGVSTLLLAYPVASKTRVGTPTAPVEPEPIAQALARQGAALHFSVQLLGLPIHSPESVHCETLNRAILQALDGGRVALGGFSLGARLLAQVSPDYPIIALAMWGYPFHTHGQPRLRPGLDSLLAVRAPCLIVQGERDPHGNRQAVQGFGPLPSHVAIHWVVGAKHRFNDPPKRLHVAQQLAHFVSPFLVG